MRTLYVVAIVCVGLTVDARPVWGGPLKKNRFNDDAAEVYRSDRLLKIDITLPADDWKALRISHRTGEQMAADPYKYYRGRVVIDGVPYESVGIRKKGFFGSVVSTRPSLKIRFDLLEKDQDFHGLDQITLNNNIQDPTLVHQFMAYRIFNDAGAISPRCNFALVSVNGESLGVYSNIESIRQPFIKRNFKDAKGRLYEGYAGDFREGPESFDRIINKSGDPLKGRKPLKRLRDTIADPASSLDEFERLVDIDAFLTFWATEVLIGHWDSYSGNRNNYYVYWDRNSKKLYFIPWGADAIFTDPGPFIWQTVPRSVKAVGALCKRLWGFPEVRRRYREEMMRLLSEVWAEDEFVAEIDKVHERLGEAASLDSPMIGFRITAAKAFIRGRRKAIEEELRNDPVWPQLRQAGAATPQLVGAEYSGKFRTKMVVGSADPFEIGSGELSVRSSEEAEPRTMENVGAMVIPEQPGFIRPGYPALNLIARGGEDDPMLNLQFFIDPIQLELNKPLPVNHFTVWAMVIEGNPRSPTAKRTIFGVSGELVLEEFDREADGGIAGRFTIRTPGFGTEAGEDSDDE